jgi:hypothetical protein
MQDILVIYWKEDTGERPLRCNKYASSGNLCAYCTEQLKHRDKQFRTDIKVSNADKEFQIDLIPTFLPFHVLKETAVFKSFSC